MNNLNRITLVALFAAIAAVGLRAQTTGGTTSGGTTTGGTTTGGTTNSTATGGSTGNPKSTAPQGNANGQNNGNTTPGTPQGNTTPGTPQGNANGLNNGNPTPGTPNTGGNNGQGSDKEKVKGPNENASQRAKDVHAVLDQFRAQRESYLAERKELLEKLKVASGEEKKKILEQLRTESAAREEEERALGKQIRDDLKKLRESRKSAE